MQNARVLLAGLTIALSGLGCAIGVDSSRNDRVKTSSFLLKEQRAHREALELKLRRARAKQIAEATARKEAPGEIAAGRGHADGNPPLSARDRAAFDAFAESIPGDVGLAVQPLGTGSAVALGPLQVGHAWSSIKVPILVTLIRDRKGSLSPAERTWAEAAVESSDNEAAASLFRRLEGIHGGLAGASSAVEATLAAAGDGETAVATAPPPAGAVSTYGQTRWSLTGATTFYRALVNGCLLGQTSTRWVLGLMENVVPEQGWGIGEAGFDPAWSAGMKGGWGPEAESGGYLVRQSAFLRRGSAGVVVSLMAENTSGTYEAGAANVTAIAMWLRDHLDGLGPRAARC